jgi:hypothetical protein
MLRIDAPAVEEKAATSPVTDNAGIAPLTEVATPAENSPPSELPKLEAALPEIPAQAETPAETDAPSPADETKIAAIAETPAAPDEAEVPAPVQATAPADDSTRIAETRIATLGGPPVTIETRLPSKIAPAVVKKQARRVIKQRRIVRRAPVTLQASQKPADPFGQPFGR